MKTKTYFSLAFLFIALFSCSPSTRLVSAWKNPETQSQEFKELMVMAMFPNTQVRVTIEDALVEKLKAQGVAAKPSYADFPLAGMTKQLMGMAKDTNIVNQIKNGFRQKIEKSGIDGLMFVNAFHIEKDKEYHPGSSLSVVAPAYGYYPSYYGNVYPSAYRGSYYDYYGYAVGTVYGQGYYTTTTTYFLQSNLFNVKTESLIWAGQTKTVDYKSLEVEAHVFADLLVKDMLQKEVVNNLNK